MNDEVDALTVADTDFEDSGRPVGSEEHGEIVEEQHADRVVVGVDHVLVEHAVLACAGEDDRIHTIKLP